MSEIDKICKVLNKGVEDVLNSERFKEYLYVQSKFHQYSFGNIILIFSQYPSASHVAGFKTWNKLGRRVKSGEKGIKIFAPIISKDKESGEEKLVGFKQVYVFDISQTDGEELPSLVQEIKTSSEIGEMLYKTLKNSIINIPIKEVPFLDNRNSKGAYDFAEKYILIREDLAIDQKAKTLIHEYAHYLTYRNDKGREYLEVVAEGTAFVVCNYFGLDTSEYSFGYLASWTTDQSDLLFNAGQEIQHTAKYIIDQIDNYNSTNKICRTA